MNLSIILVLAAAILQFDKANSYFLSKKIAIKSYDGKTVFKYPDSNFPNKSDVRNKTWRITTDAADRHQLQDDIESRFISSPKICPKGYVSGLFECEKS